MPAGTEVGVAYVTIVPSAQNFGAKLRSQITPRMLGQQLGAELSEGIGDQLVVKAKIKGEAAGDALGKGFSNNVKTHMGNTERTISDGVNRGLAGLKRLAMGFATVAGGGLFMGKQFFDAASDLNESASKAQTVFQGAFGQIEQMADTSAQSMGLSRQAAYEAAATFGNLFRAMGIGTDTAATMSTGLLRLASDLASFNNVTPEEALEALRSGLVGETEPLRRFGVNINEDRIKAEALSKGLVKTTVNAGKVKDATVALDKANRKAADALKKHGDQSVEYRDALADVDKAERNLNEAMQGTKVDLDAASKAQAIYSLIMKDTTIAQGDFDRTADGAANKTRILAAEWEDAKGRIGTALQPLGITLLDLANTALVNLQNWWTTNGPGVLGFFDNLKQKFFDIFGPDPVASFKVGWDIIKGWFDALLGPGSAQAQAGGPLTLLDQVRVGLDNVFGADKVANFKIGFDVVKGWVDALVGPGSPEAQAGGALTPLDQIRVGLDGIFGADKVANFKIGYDQIKGWVDELRKPPTGEPSILDETAGKLDALFGPDKAKSLYMGTQLIKWGWDQLWARFELGAYVLSRVTQPVFETIGKTLIWFKDKALDPLWGFIQDTVWPFIRDTLIPLGFGVFALQLKPFIDGVNNGIDAVSNMIIYAGDLIEKVIDPLIGTLQNIYDKIQIARDNPVISAMMRAGGIPGFAIGGVVPGATGSAQAALVHGGETVIPTHRPEYAALRGITAATIAGMAAAPARTAGPALQIDRLEVTGQNDPNATAWAIRRELRRMAYFAGGW